MGLSWKACSYFFIGMVNFGCIVFEQGVKMLTLSSMEKLIVECNLKASLRNLP